jgi:hypothetical protein
MNSKPLITIGVLVGTTIGGLIPMLWHAPIFSFSSVIFSTLGGIVGIWAGVKIGQMYF